MNKVEIKSLDKKIPIQNNDKKYKNCQLYEKKNSRKKLPMTYVKARKVNFSNTWNCSKLSRF